MTSTFPYAIQCVLTFDELLAKLRALVNFRKSEGAIH